MTLPSSALGIVLAILLLPAGGCVGSAAVPAMAAMGALIQDTVSTLADQVEVAYFDPVVGGKVAARLREGLAKGRYAGVSGREALATLLSSEMYAVAKDKHLALAVTLPPPLASSPLSAGAGESREERGRRENFGLQKVELLPGNIGYLRLTCFYRPQETREAIAMAMAFLGQADALILDFRDHGGGSVETVALFSSYFLDPPGLPLFEIASRPPAVPDRYATESGVLAHRNGTRPTFVLTSPRTCSGGEGVAFLLQERHRAEVIGESTWGGANRVPPPRPVHADFQASIPNGRFGSVLTGKSWEGVGVLPDLPVRADRALKVAHARALQAVLKSAAPGSWHDGLLQELARVEREVAAEALAR